MSHEVPTFIQTVTDFWQKSGRHELPWRKTQDPYAILVSEIMLQQTQVDRVIPYFKKWMKKFPTVQTLSRCHLDSVLRAWSGLGYNRRAKMLRECAKEIVEKYDGKVPKDFAALKALPGIGPYTAGAIRVFAFNEPDVLIETNIRSAYIHHFFPDDVKKKRTITHAYRSALSYVGDKEIRVIAERAAKGQDPRIWHSALMDYGSYLKKNNPNPSRRSKHHTKQSKFEGSLRQVRGAILKAYTHGKSQSAVRQTYGRRYEEAYQSLVRDGLIKT